MEGRTGPLLAGRSTHSKMEISFRRQRRKTYCYEDVHGGETHFADVRLLVLHGPKDRVNDCFEALLSHLEHPLDAVLDYMLYECEESHSELGEGLVIISDHDERRLTEDEQNLRQKLGEHWPHILQHGCEELQDFGVPRAWVVLTVILNQALERRQELCPENSQVRSCIFYIDWN